MRKIRFRKFWWNVLITIALVVFIITAVVLVRTNYISRDILTVFHAGSLAAPLDAVAERFTGHYPDVAVERELAGSRTTIRKVTELGKSADIIASADYVAIEQLMFPDYADWYIIFASNEMGIAFTDTSKFGDEINVDNWYQVLTREGVEYGRSDPNADPAGYRTLMVWQLAEQYYDVPGLYEQLFAGSPEKNIRPKETDLIALLDSGDLDYAFEYRSIAVQRGLRYLELPPQINLADAGYTDFYASAKVEVAGSQPGETDTQIGQPILYAITIPESALRPELGIAFIRFLLGSEGQAIIEQLGQVPVIPAIAGNHHKIPSELKEYVVER